MMRSSLWFRFALCVALALALPGCKTVGSWFGSEKEAKTERLAVEEMYAEAKQNLLDGDYGDANPY